MDTTYTNVVDASTSQIASDTKFHVAGLDLYYDKFHALKDINIDIPESRSQRLSDHPVVVNPHS